MADQSYTPINCGFYDLLEIAAMQKKFVRISYYSEYKEILAAGGVIKNLYAKDGEEFMELSTGPIIRLDRLIRLDDKYVPGKEAEGKNHCSL
ncbi:MAG: hypothetical protein AAF206_29515 [Bacteroidota bacterium]